MSEDRRKNLRTQGKYSDGRAQKSRDKKRSSLETRNSPPETRVPRRHSDGSRNGNNSLSDENASFLKYEENSDYTFEQLEEVARPVEITNKGSFVLSKTKNGESRILFEPSFLPEHIGNDYFNHLFDNINFDKRNIVIHGIEYPQPRLVAWFGPFPYHYSGVALEPAEMPDIVKEIKDKVEKFLISQDIKVTFNSVLINLYRSGKDSVSWHSDDELMLGISPTIASVSLGETRKFEIRPKIRNYDGKNPSDSSAKFLLYLNHGSLVIMTGSMQEDWQHRVPKEYHDRGPRINLTFRTVYSLEEAPEYVPAKGIRKETAKKSHGRNSSSALSKHGYKFDDEHFPSLQKDIGSVNSNVTCDKNDNADEKNWDSDISDGEHNIESVITDKITCPAFHKRSEDFRPKNCSKNKFNNEKSLKKWNSIGPKCDYKKVTIDDKTATKKLWCEEYDSSVNSIQESNLAEERCEMKSYKSVNDSSANEIEENKFYDKIDPRNVHNRESSLTVRNSQQYFLNQEESSVKSCSNKSNSYANATQENDVNSEEFPNTCPDNKNNLWIGSLEDSNLDAEKATKMPLNVNAKAFTNSYKNVTQENDLDNKMLPNSSCYAENNSSWANVSEENNLQIKQPSKMVLNVDAKEFIPSNIKANDINLFDDFELEDLIKCDLKLLQGINLQNHTHYLKMRILERIHEICRFDRKEIEFLLAITDGSQTDKNQRLISEQICRIVENSLLRNQLPSNSVTWSSRQRGYDNQSYSDPRKRYPSRKNEKFCRKF